MLILLDRQQLRVHRSLPDTVLTLAQHCVKRFRRPGGGLAVEQLLMRELTLQNQLVWTAGVGGQPELTAAVAWVLNSRRDLRNGIRLKQQKKIAQLWAGPNLVVVPQEAQGLIESPEIDRYIVPCQWVADFIARESPRLKNKLTIWPVGLDTDYWKDSEPCPKTTVLIYNKNQPDLSVRISKTAALKGVNIQTIHYGRYKPKVYREALRHARAMVWLSRSESQGLACLEALSMNVPVIAWDPGEMQYNSPVLKQSFSCPSSSVPYFDARCGNRFSTVDDFSEQWESFLTRIHDYQPRQFVLDSRLDLNSNLLRLPFDSILAQGGQQSS